MTVSYLRVSVTDRCNQRCVYCMPAEGIRLRSHDETLRYEEIERVVRCAVRLGVRSVRLTGGEPLVRRGIVDFAARLARLPGLEDLALTTNGVGLGELARPLRRAGVRRLNLSLDTLHPDRYREITRTDFFEKARAGLEAARAAGFSPIKVNTVVVRGLNDDEVVDMALTAADDLVWRFIELMPLGEGHAWGAEALVPADEIVDRLRKGAARRGLAFEIEDDESRPPGFGAGPARYFRFGDHRVGVISPMTHGFCGDCNRLRLTSDGKLHPCLASPLEVDLAGLLRGGASDDDLVAALADAVTLKPRAHALAGRGPELAERRMWRIGG